MKKQLSTLALILALFSNTKISTADNQIKIIKDLKINPSLKYQTVCYKNESAGVKDLEKIFKHNRYFKNAIEESWVFAPMNPPQSSKWLETGIGTFKTVKDTIYVVGIGVKKEIFEEAAKKYSFLVDYHIHPMALPKKLIEERALEIFKSKQNTKSRSLEELTNKLEQNYIALSGLPSTEDINFAVMRTRQMRKINPTLKLNFKICSTYGVTSYNLTPKGKEIFGKELNADFYLSWLNQKEKNNLSLNFSQMLDSLDLTRNFARQLSDSLLIINFQSYEEFYSSH